MKRCKLRYWLLWSCVLVLVACGKGEWVDNASVNERNASLRLTFKPTETKLSTRGVEDLDDDGEVTLIERFLDGREMFRLGVFLANSEGDVVASTVLEMDDARFNNGNTEAEVEFNNLGYNETYTLYAVANYGNYGDELVGFISDITADNVTNPLQVQASTDNLCNRSLVYPLSLKAEIPLNQGENTFLGNLKRAFARLRIGVSNGTSKKLTVVNLDFPDDFVQSSADLFTEGGTADVKPIVTSSHAITPFQTNTVVPKEGTTTIFDSYLLESNSGTYNYTLELMLGEDAGYEIKTKDNQGNIEQIKDRNNVNGNGKGPYYVIRNVLSGKYLYANSATNKVELGDSYGEDEAIDANYVWKLTKIEDRGDIFDFYIESMGTPGSFLKAGNSQESLSLTTNNDYIRIDTHADRLIFNKGNNYIAVNNNTAYWHYGKLGDNQNIQQFIFYEVRPLHHQQDGAGDSGSVSLLKTIPIDIDAIHRNDFINILVNVSDDGSSRTVNSTCVIE